VRTGKERLLISNDDKVDFAFFSLAVAYSLDQRVSKNVIAYQINLHKCTL